MSHKLDTNELDSLEIDGVGEVYPGIVLEHPTFGVGKVEAIYQFIRSDDVAIRIDFEEHGSKALAPEYANLSKPISKDASENRPNSEIKQGIFSRLFGSRK